MVFSIVLAKSPPTTVPWSVSVNETALSGALVPLVWAFPVLAPVSCMKDQSVCSYNCSVTGITKVHTKQ